MRNFKIVVAVRFIWYGGGGVLVGWLRYPGDLAKIKY